MIYNDAKILDGDQVIYDEIQVDYEGGYVTTTTGVEQGWRGTIYPPHDRLESGKKYTLVLPKIGQAAICVGGPLSGDDARLEFAGLGLPPGIQEDSGEAAS